MGQQARKNLAVARCCTKNTTFTVACEASLRQSLSKHEGFLDDGRKSGARRPVSRVLSHPLPGTDGHSSGTRIAAGFARPTRAEGRDRPCVSASPRLAVRPYSALLPVGFAVPPPLPEARWALAPPFHPCPEASRRPGGLFSVALSLGSPPPAISRHRSPVEPGLSSSPRSLADQRPSGRLTPRRVCACRAWRVKRRRPQPQRRGARASRRRQRHPRGRAASGAGRP